MKRAYFTVFASVLVICATAQSKATIQRDTTAYLGHYFAIGDTITAGYGSKADKGFAFLKMGSDLGGYSDLVKEFSRYDAVIDKIKQVGKVVYIRAKFTERNISNKLLVDLEGAIDNKELKIN